MKRKILSTLCIAFYLTVVVILMYGCQKKAQLKKDELIAGSDLDPLVSASLQLLNANSSSYVFLQKFQGQWGQMDWSRALPARNPDELVCILPFVASERKQVQALAIISFSDSIRIKFVTAAVPYSMSNDSLPRKELLLLQFMNFKWFGIQPRRPWAITFKNTRPQDSSTFQTSQGRAVPYVVSICYDVVICTGDGYGNCVGNYRYYSECISSTYWIEGFDYVGGYGPATGPDSDRSGGAGGNSGGAETYLLPPSVRIDNVSEYLQCFNGNQPGRLIVYVDQPLPGSDEPFTILGKMGHVFISLEQTSSSGIVRRFMGFYPDTRVNPFGKKYAHSALANDNGKQYDLFLPISLSGQQFQNVMGAIRNFHPTYNLETYNCVDFAIDVALAANVHLPVNAGWWLLGSGRNPGRFGEDLKAINGTVINSGKSPLNAFSCR